MTENVIFLYIPFQDDDTVESVVACTLEADLLQNTTGNDEVIIIVDIRRIRKVATKLVPMSYKGDLDFLCDCSVTSEHLSPWTHAYSWYPPKTWMFGTRTIDRSRGETGTVCVTSIVYESRTLAELLAFT